MNPAYFYKLYHYGNTLATANMYAEILINRKAKSLDRLFTYEIPDALKEKIFPGSIVSVPLGKGEAEGFVIRITETCQLPYGTTIKSITGALAEESAWRKEMQDIIIWMRDYYGCSFLEAVNAALPSHFSTEDGKVKMGAGLKKEILIKVISRDPSAIGKNALRQRRIFEEILEAGKGEVIKTGQMPLAQLRILESKGLIRLEESFSEQSGGKHFEPLEKDPSFALSPDQEKALSEITDLMQSGKASGALLLGVTGSGKTVVYMEAIEKALSMGKNAIVLVPELSLTAQFAGIYRSRFGEQVAILHSGLSDSVRGSEWRRIMRGEARVILGARSAIFAPISDLGIIIIDEEHENAYKQENSPRYHARHVAVKRAASNGCLLLLGSATPSFETYLRAVSGGYRLIELPKRISGNTPEIKVIDMKMPWNRNKEGMISPFLAKKIGKALKEGHQAILFINRRGFFNYLFCEDCGKIITCPNCDIALRFHKSPPSLKCHYCGYSKTPDDECPSCRSLNLKPGGGGTQRIEDEIHSLFPEARILRMDRDSVSKRDSAETIYRSFKNGEADILIGTQMIAKGFDFPNVSLSAVVLADTSFAMPDFRAPEKTHQLLMQVCGRAGRRLEESLCVIQTYDPEHPAIKASLSGNFNFFCLNELNARKEFGYPPYNHLVRIVFQSQDSELCSRYAKKFSELFECADGEVKTGPALCPIGRINGIFRMQLNIKCRNVPAVTAKYRAISERLKNKFVSSFIDADSTSFL